MKRKESRSGIEPRSFRLIARPNRLSELSKLQPTEVLQFLRRQSRKFTGQCGSDHIWPARVQLVSQCTVYATTHSFHGLCGSSLACKRRVRVTLSGLVCTYYKSQASDQSPRHSVIHSTRGSTLLFIHTPGFRPHRKWFAQTVYRHSGFAVWTQTRDATLRYATQHYITLHY